MDSLQTCESGGSNKTIEIDLNDFYMVPLAFASGVFNALPSRTSISRRTSEDAMGKIEPLIHHLDAQRRMKRSKVESEMMQSWKQTRSPEAKLDF